MKKIYILCLLFLTVGNASGQDLNLGVVWSNTYDYAPAGVAVQIMAQPLYYKQTKQARYLVTGTETPRNGFISMIDESGNQLKYWSIPIPEYYDKYPVQPASERGGFELSFYNTFQALYKVSAPQDILASVITSAVMKPDGSILAFGYVYRHRADSWSVGTPDYSPGSHAICRMLEGVWKIRIDSDGNIIENTRARGAHAYRMFIYENKILLPGLDIHEPANVGDLGTKGRGVGMLHEYDLDGNFIAERCHPSIDGFATTEVKQMPDGNIFVGGWHNTGTLIDGVTYAKTQSFDAKVVNAAATNIPMIGTGTVEGGFFVNPQFSANGNSPKGSTLAKLNKNGTLAYKVFESETSRTVLYEKPYVLDSVNGIYVGTINQNGKNSIYKIKDDLTTYTRTIGDTFPNNTVLMEVSLKDGFFSLGRNVKNKISVAKLSTCAGFKLDVGSTENYIETGSSFLTRTITHTGAQTPGTVSYSWTLEDVTTGGKVISELATNKVGTTNILPTQTLSLMAGKTYGEAEYTITAINNYTNNGVAQSCTQTYNIKVVVSAPISSTLFSDDIWFFGQKGADDASKGIRFKNINGSMVAEDYSGISAVNSRENSLSASTPACDGSFIFYTQHDYVFNSMHQKMEGGSFQGHTSNSDGLAAAYIGKNKYIFMSVSTEGDKGNLNYYIIDMSLEEKLGKMFPGGTIDGSNKVGEAIELIPKVNTFDEYWLIYYRSDLRKFVVYAIKGNDGVPVFTKIKEYDSHLVPGVAHIYDLKSNGSHTIITALLSNQFALFTFNPANGDMEHKITIDNAGSGISNNLYSAEFSQNGKYLYLTDIWTVANSGETTKLMQYDISNINNPVFVNSVAYSEPNARAGFIGGSAKIGPDGRMYVLRSYSDKMAIVADPNSPLTNASIDLEGFELTAVGEESLHISVGLTPPWINPPSSPSITPKADTDISVTFDKLPVTIYPLANDVGNCAQSELSFTQVTFLNSRDISKLDFTYQAAEKSLEFKNKTGYTFTSDTIITLTYILKDNGVPVQLCDEGFIKILVKATPKIVLMDSCTFTPKLLIDISFPDVDFVWQKQNGATWEDIAGTKNKNIHSTVNEGLYRAKIWQKSDDTQTIFTDPQQYTINNKYDLTSGTWYKVSLQ